MLVVAASAIQLLDSFISVLKSIPSSIVDGSNTFNVSSEQFFLACSIVSTEGQKGLESKKQEAHDNRIFLIKASKLQRFRFFHSSAWTSSSPQALLMKALQQNRVSCWTFTIFSIMFKSTHSMKHLNEGAICILFAAHYILICLRWIERTHFLNKLRLKYWTMSSAKDHVLKRQLCTQHSWAEAVAQRPSKHSNICLP